MFGIFTKKKSGEEIVLNIIGMHCTSCAMNIDGALEDMPGVIEAKTSYAKQQVSVRIVPHKVTRGQLIKAISKVGYQAK